MVYARDVYASKMTASGVNAWDFYYLEQLNIIDRRVCPINDLLCLDLTKQKRLELEHKSDFLGGGCRCECPTGFTATSPDKSMCAKNEGSQPVETTRLDLKTYVTINFHFSMYGLRTCLNNPTWLGKTHIKKGGFF